MSFFNQMDSTPSIMPTAGIAEYPMLKKATCEMDMLELSSALNGAIIIPAKEKKRLLIERERNRKWIAFAEMRWGYITDCGEALKTHNRLYIECMKRIWNMFHEGKEKA